MPGTCKKDVLWINASSNYFLKEYWDDELGSKRFSKISFFRKMNTCGLVHREFNFQCIWSIKFLKIWHLWQVQCVPRMHLLIWKSQLWIFENIDHHDIKSALVQVNVFRTGFKQLTFQFRLRSLVTNSCHCIFCCDYGYFFGYLNSLVWGVMAQDFDCSKKLFEIFEF